MKKLERLCCVLMMFLTLIGCSSSTPQTHDVIFQDSIRIDLGDDDVNTAEYVKRIVKEQLGFLAYGTDELKTILMNGFNVSQVDYTLPKLSQSKIKKLEKQYMNS